jgi:2-hydroxy-6-oxonona-2,4-dienedioate hydrolase
VRNPTSDLVQRPVGRRVTFAGDALGGPTGRLVSTWVPVHGLRLHALVSVEDLPPETPTIVLVHGVAVSSRYLVPLAEHLAPRARVYVPDLPGYGRSDRPPGADLTVPELADVLLAWMDRVGLYRPHLIGNSFGCQVIADLAARYPDRVGRLVLQGPTMDPHARSAWRQSLRWLAVVPFERYLEGLVLLRDVWDLGPRRAASMIWIALNDPIEQKLARTVAPALVVRGTRDAIVPQTWAEEATRLLPDGRLVVIERAAHTINYSQPAWLVDAVWPFLIGSGDAST